MNFHSRGCLETKSTFRLVFAAPLPVRFHQNVSNQRTDRMDEEPNKEEKEKKKKEDKP